MQPTRLTLRTCDTVVKQLCPELTAGARVRVLAGISSLPNIAGSSLWPEK